MYQQNDNSIWAKLKKVKYACSDVCDLTANTSQAFHGTVQVDVDDDAINFSEVYLSSANSNSQNSLKWEKKDGCLVLSHTRQQKPETIAVFVYDENDESGEFKSHPYYCNKDAYHSNLSISEDQINLSWTINGPEKHLTISTRYSFG